jgi:capsular polysaccharide biosynthesis protein
MSDGRFVLEEMGTTGMFKSRMSNTFDSFSPEETLREVTQPLATETGDYDYDTILNLVPRHGAEFNNYANFAHWLLEDLPRLRAYNYYSDATGGDVKLLLKRDPPAWMTDTLRCMGFQYTDWIEWDQQSARVKNLVVPRMSYIHSTGSQFAPASRRWVGETIRNGCGVETSEHPKRVFISRQKSDRRKITNFDEVMDELKPLGFRPYNLEDLTIEEEISLFSQADMIVGVHGAGLATTIYAEDITLLELFPHDVSATTYFILANEMGFDYGSFVAEAPDPNNKDNKKNLDLRVNTEELREAIVNIIPSNQ